MAFESYMSFKGKSQGGLKGSSKGGSNGGRNKDWTKILTVYSGVLRPWQGTPGKHRKPIVITKEWGAASPQLLQAHWTGDALEVVIEIVGRPSSGAGESVMGRITFSDVLVSSYRRVGGSPGTHSEHGTSQLEQVGLTFQKIAVENVAAVTSATDDWTANNS